MNTERQVTKHVKDNGNIVYSYIPISNKETLLQRVIIPELLLLIISFIVYSIISQLEILILLGIIFVIFSITILYKWIVYTEKLNSEIEKNIIDKSLKEMINKTVSSLGSDVNELEKKIDLKTDEYGGIKEKFLLVVLSNGTFLRYNIIHISHLHKILVQEININPEIISK